MQDFVREELRCLGMTDAEIREMEERSEKVNSHLKSGRGSALWFTDTRRQEGPNPTLVSPAANSYVVLSL